MENNIITNGPGMEKHKNINFNTKAENLSSKLQRRQLAFSPSTDTGSPNLPRGHAAVPWHGSWCFPALLARDRKDPSLGRQSQNEFY